MGDVTVAAFGALALVGLSLVGWGVAHRTRVPLLGGAALLLGLGGAWVAGLPGVALGAIPVVFLVRRRRTMSASSGRGDAPDPMP